MPSLSPRKVSVGVLPSADPQMAAFRKVPFYQETFFAYQLLGLIPLIAAFASFALLFEGLPVLAKNPWAVLASFVLAFGGGGLGGLLLIRRSAFFWMLAEKRRDQEKLGTAPSESSFVGVAYSEEAWGLQNDTSWDRGYLSLNESDLSFRGFASEFKLPLSAVQQIEIAATRSMITSNLPRIYLWWTHPDGRRNAVAIEVRDAGSRTATIARQEALAHEIEHAVATSNSSDSGPVWPIESSSFDFTSIDPGTPAVESSDRWLAGLAAAIFVALMVLMLKELTTRLKVDLGLLLIAFAGSIAGSVYNGVVMWRVKQRIERRKHRGPEDG